MNVTYTLNSIGMYGGSRSNWNSAYWENYSPTGSSDGSRRWVGKDSGTYFVTNILFNTTELDKLKTKTIVSIQLKVKKIGGTIPTSGSTIYQVGYKLNSDTITANAWARSDNGTSVSTTTLGYLSGDNSNTDFTISLTGSVPKYGYCIGPAQNADMFTELNGSAQLIIVVDEPSTVRIVNSSSGLDMYRVYIVNGNSGLDSYRVYIVNSGGTLDPYS